MYKQNIKKSRDFSSFSQFEKISCFSSLNFAAVIKNSARNKLSKIDIFIHMNCISATNSTVD